MSKRDDTDLSLLYPAHNFSVPVDHFHNETKYEPHCNDTFNLRYWFDASHYKAGGPVIILQSGETSGKARLPFLQKGLLAQMAEATGGIAVVLEHRYYGTSYPVPDLSTENFRFLTTEQAMADEAYFASNIQFPGLEEHGDLTAKTTPYIGYGGSYAGAFNAFLRVQYPDIFWGTISSSGVTKAIDDYWQYYQAIAEYAPPDCVASHRALVSFLDGILIGKKHLSTELKTVFDMQNVTYDDDFATAITVNPIAGWQSLNWDPAVSSHKFYSYCSNITSADILYPGTESKRSAVEKLIGESDSEADVNVNSILNVIGYTNLTQVSKQVSSDKTQDQYFGNARDATHNSLTSIEEAAWKSWPYQYCTEWGVSSPHIIPYLMGQKESTPQNAETCPYKTRVLIKHIIVLPNRQHSPRIRPPPRLPHRRPRLHQSRLPTRLQRYLAPQPPSRKQIWWIRNLLPAPRHRRRRMGPLETRYTARL